MARGSKGGSTGSLDIAGTVTAVPCIVSAGKTRRWDSKDCARNIGVAAWPASLLQEAVLTTVRRLAVLISVSRRGERARILRVKSAQRGLDAVAKTSDALFDGWAQ